jgi:hypothetical protein
MAAARRRDLERVMAQARFALTTCETSMKKALAILLMVGSMSSLAFAADVPVYPGAKMNEMLTKADQAEHPGSVAYTTADAFEKVYEFYQTKGTENPHMKGISPDYKSGAFTFPGTHIDVAIFWVRQSNATMGNMVHLVNRKDAK